MSKAITCLTIALALAGCADSHERRQARLGLALILPMADVGDIHNLGLYALAISSGDAICEHYLDGGEDPIASHPATLCAVDYIEVGSVDDGFSHTFGGIPQGDKTILVECYDAQGRRLFMGCAQAEIKEGQTVQLELVMSEDPASPRNEE